VANEAAFPLARKTSANRGRRQDVREIEFMSLSAPIVPGQLNPNIANVASSCEVKKEQRAVFRR
jgi:hypothetical protein